MFKGKPRQPSAPKPEEMELSLLPNFCYGRFGWDKKFGRTMLFKDHRGSVMRALGFLTVFSNSMWDKYISVGFLPIEPDLENIDDDDDDDSIVEASQNALKHFSEAVDEGFDVVGKITRHGIFNKISGKLTGDFSIGIQKYKIQCNLSMKQIIIIPYDRNGELIANKRVIMEQ
jgi:hypothetical protein